MSESVEVRHSAELGRYAIAAKDVEAGELLFEELPFVIGPKPQTRVVCLGCCCPLVGSDARCSECRWPLCSESCASRELHRRECELFVANRVRFHERGGDADENAVCMQLDCITPLRMLLEKDAQPERWTREISLMECHTEQRRQRDTWHADQVNIVGYLHGPCKLRDRFNADLVQQVCGILEVNSFEGRTLGGHSVRCIFPRTAIMAHSCVPNTMHTILPSKNFRIQVRATVDVPKDELLYASYTYTMTGTAARQKHLQAGKFFTCHCERCLDPTELNTHFSSIKCRSCPGLLSTSNPLDTSAPWICSHCSFQTAADSVLQATTYIQEEVDAIQNPPSGRIEQCEHLLRKYSPILHANHSILTALRQMLVEMYGRTPGYTFAELPAIMLDRKSDLCVQVLSVLNIMHPGMTRSRALLMYEMHGPMVLAAKSKLAAQVIDQREYRSNLQQAIQMLDFCVSVLRWEDEASAEATLCRIASIAVKQLRAEVELLFIE